jgi:solute carrier family 13 (sodium-dependent dicarboxylate transporter), member 2/3/5
MIDFLKRRYIHDDLHHWLTRLARRLDLRQPLRMGGVGLLVACLAVSVLVVYFLLQTDLARPAVFMAGIFVLSALLWSTEALPLFATALLAIGLQIIFIANPGEWAILAGPEAPPDYRTFIAPFADPIIILFLGGFLLASAAIKEGVDGAMAGVILRAFRGNPRLVMLGLMIVTAVFSMFMSNTATAAMMITLVVAMLPQIPRKDPIRKAMVLCVPFAANIGGMGTPISSPPNAVAVGFLQRAGLEVTFLQWMLIALPIMTVLLIATWLLLGVLFRTKSHDLVLEPERRSIDGRGWFVMMIFFITVGLWLSDAWHGLPTAVVALLPAIAFTTTGVLGRKDYNSLEWHILTLIAGGIALGTGMQVTGLDQAMIALVPVDGAYVLAAMAVATVLLSTFMSNTAAANLLVPIGVALAATDLLRFEMGIMIALAASIAMALPVSTPPNAIAYAYGEFETRDIAIAGGLIGVIALGLLVLLAPWLITVVLGV